ncbi:polysaccharide deacetylase family protein [Streptomyces zagrosensis]|uniref:Peptidoglycan/xylan/chitin deacetylase (PgdA/CDA1 family) n=1 Tax=Streptomyces zagrosensis TaxID=1042984 RepID=A0A7W9QEL2_9ACTN|nr:polysaccharide deacetylase family protein [Streptomyces zagrosensis]MBB5938706.1 peptidoglycan/xylan/chitin deacetylase (PgdA/CDA1 family) [Streptomyces zagrosensis]
MDNPPYDYSPIVGREPIRWPGGARIAFYVAVNVEHYQLGRPSLSISPSTAELAPDPLNHGWRDYGPRVGIWRLIDSLDRYPLRASVMLNSDVCARYPQIIEAGRARHWAWIAHGKNNSILQADMTPDAERAYLADVIDTIDKATGHRPRGWLGPALTETFYTPALLAELGLGYVLDWANDDQPYWLNVPEMLSVPYPIELNDISLFVGQSLSGPDFLQIVKDQLDQLYAESADSGRVMSLALHPFIINQPFRHKYVVQALDYIVQHPGIWLTTSDEIAQHYALTHARGPI